MALQVKKLNLDLTGSASSNIITDEHYNNVGSATPFGLGHSRFAGSTLNIYTGAGNTGYHLITPTDYTLGGQDVALSARAGFTVYSTVSIVNPTYQSGNLYISYHVIADVVDASDQYNISLAPGFQYIKQNNDGSISVIANVITLGDVNTTTLTIGTQTIWDSTLGLHLQTASTLVLGAVKVDGTSITIDGFGVISSTSVLRTAGSSSVGAVQYNGTVQAAGQFDGGVTAPSHTTQLNYDGYLTATRLTATSGVYVASGQAFTFLGSGSNYLNLISTPTGVGLSITIPSVSGTALISLAAQGHGYFDTSGTAPTHTDRLNYDGNLYVNSLISTVGISVAGITIGLGGGTLSSNLAIGASALAQNTIGNNNVAIGENSQNAGVGAARNVSLGFNTLFTNVSGVDSVAIGDSALDFVTAAAGKNTAIGSSAGTSLLTGSNDIMIGYNAQPSSSSASNEITLGDTSITTLRIGSTTIWDSTLGLHIPVASTIVLGGVKIDGTTITISGSNVISASTATSATLGVVQPDGTVITVSGGGAITVPQATTLAFGVVKPDGTTITVSSGIISAVSSAISLVQAGSSTVGAVQYNGATQSTGMFDGSSTIPAHTLRLNYDGNLFVTNLVPVGPGGVLDNVSVGYVALASNTSSGLYNVAVGRAALNANTSGTDNVAVGYYALHANVTNNDNTAIGFSALISSTANNNTAIGSNALFTTVTGANNTAVGANALSNTTGNGNVAVGSGAGTNLTSGSNNIIIGTSAQPSSATVSNEITLGDTNITTLRVGSTTIWDSIGGFHITSIPNDITVNGLTVGIGAGAISTNTVLGFSALASNTTGLRNVAIGYSALTTNSTGAQNVAVGFNALTANTGSANTAVGTVALQLNTGSFNTAVGQGALSSNVSGYQNTAVGKDALILSTGIYNTAIGEEAGSNVTTGTNDIIIGYLAQSSTATVSNEITIGNSSIDTFRIGITTIWDSTAGLHVSKATSSTLGVVQPDNTTITVNGSGVITAIASTFPIATTSTLGAVIPDGSSIAVSPTGVISIDSFFLNNLCKNSDFSSGLTTGWISSGCLSISVTSVNPLSGTYSGLISSNEPIGSGGYVAYPFTIPLGVNQLQINYSYQGRTNFNPLIPLSLQMFDVTNNVYLVGSFSCLSDTGTNSAIFITSPNSLSYQLRFVYSIPSIDVVALAETNGNTVIQAFTNFSQLNTWTYAIDEISILPSNANRIPSDLTIDGDLRVAGDVHAGRVFNAVWNDLAEFMYKVPGTNAEPGDVLIQTDKGLTRSTKKSDAAVVGVYSDSYGYALGAADADAKYPVALAGVVYVKVREPLEIGNLLVSDIDGYATKTNVPLFGTILGKVLENKTGYDTSRIKMLVQHN